MESLGLVQRLETKEVLSNRIKDENFAKLKKIGSVLGKQMLIDIQKDFNRLNYLMQDSLFPALFESAFDDSEYDFDKQSESRGGQVGDKK